MDLSDTPESAEGIITSTPNGASAVPVTFGAPVRRRQRTVAADPPLFSSSSRGDSSSVRPNSLVSEDLPDTSIVYM